MILFSRERGQVARIDDPTAGLNSIGAIRFPSLDYLTDGGEGNDVALLLTDCQIEPRPLYQVTDTLGNAIMLTVFNESLTNIRLSGLCYDSLCDNPSPDASGVERLLEYYDDTNATSRINAAPVQLTIGVNRTMNCFLFNFRAAVADPVSRVWQFDATLGGIPYRTQLAAAQQVQQATATTGRSFTNSVFDFDSPVVDASSPVFRSDPSALISQGFIT